MAIITARFATNIAQIDLFDLADSATSVQFLDNFNLPSLVRPGVVYEDVVRLTVPGTPASQADFAGSAITVNTVTGAVTGGTMQAFIARAFNGSNFVPWYSVEGISVSAVAVYNATQTVSTADDMSLLATALAGSDTFNLSSGADVANGFGGNDTLRGFGGNDTLGGGTGSDWIDGGSGADRLLGGVGDDVFVVDATGDVVVEAAASGIDTVRSAVSHALAANVENLILIGGAVAGAGNALANRVLGNGAANVLNGGAGRDLLRGGVGNDTVNGGVGNDTLYGDPGLDTIRFTSAPLASNADRVVGFVSADDRVQLDNAAFTALGAAGALPAAMFHLGSAAHDASDRLIYNQATGALLYDADGTGAIAAVLVANFGAGTALTLGDLFVV